MVVVEKNQLADRRTGILGRATEEPAGVTLLLYDTLVLSSFQGIHGLISIRNTHVTWHLQAVTLINDISSVNRERSSLAERRLGAAEEQDRICNLLGRDMRDLALGRSYDVITCMFGSIAYLNGRDADGENDNEVRSEQFELAGYWHGQFGRLSAYARGSAAMINFDGKRFFQSVDSGGDPVTRTTRGSWNGELFSSTASAHASTTSRMPASRTRRGRSSPRASTFPASGRSPRRRSACTSRPWPTRPCRPCASPPTTSPSE